MKNYWGEIVVSAHDVGCVCSTMRWSFENDNPPAAHGNAGCGGSVVVGRRVKAAVFAASATTEAIGSSSLVLLAAMPATFGVAVATGIATMFGNGEAGSLPVVIFFLSAMVVRVH